jgi:hypothetical protein
MKMKIFTITLFLTSCFAMAQKSDAPQEMSLKRLETNSNGQQVITFQPSAFLHTSPAREWPQLEDSRIPSADKLKIRNNFERDGYLEAQAQIETDPVVQKIAGTKTNRAPIINKNGLSGSGLPPDPTGAAGPNHYVQAVNTSVRCWTNTGSVVPGGTFSLSSLWSGSDNAGDPIVMYDRHADRWFISQFNDSPNRILIAVSVTGDPTGAYYAYSYTFSQFPDYPKYSIWWDGYYMTSNSTHTAVVFERDKMLAGDPTAQMVSLSLPSLGSGGFRSPLPADADGPLPPSGTPCYFFNLEDNAFNGVSQDQIEIYEMNTDWTNTGNTSVSSSQQLSVPSFDAVFTGGFANISQPGTSQRIDAIQGVLMYRAQHMRWTGYNTIILSHAVDMGGNRSAVRWYELRDANDGNWSVYQAGTYDPTNDSRFMSSAAMDNYGNIALAYSICNSTSIYPGIRYTGRLSTDPLGQMTFAEETAIDGEGSQTFADRFGDYSHMSLDPNGGTFWHTGEYLAAGGSSRTRFFSFRLAGGAGIDIANPYYSNLEMNVHQSNDDLNINVAGIYGNTSVVMEVIAMNGQVVKTLGLKYPEDGVVSGNIDVSSLETGIYFVRVGNTSFQTTEKVLIK